MATQSINYGRYIPVIIVCIVRTSSTMGNVYKQYAGCVHDIKSIFPLVAC